jgi:serine/threonine protein kinase
MLTGDPPFQVYGANGVENWAVLFAQICEGEPDIGLEMGCPARDLIERLLVKDPKQRIGFEEIVEHPWFEGFDWEIVARAGYIPGWRPVLDANGICKQNFDPDALREPLVDTPVAAAAQALQIENFSFVAQITDVLESEEPGRSLIVPEEA